ncbi:hypothetical protein B1750_gp051 [Noumeavirus]|uniref:hypothetical protein n=1 Tax=Noumeavirus TaxID=1955558 RepID=UPI000982D72C|nr:hypothetical protein B1750_gp051 [Noumeavirus]AQM73032.1 hypothetical protein NMV_051 [Noumeavirus]
MTLISILDVEFEFAPRGKPCHKHKISYYEDAKKWSVSNNFMEPNNPFWKHYKKYYNSLEDAVHAFFDAVLSDPYSSEKRLYGKIRAHSVGDFRQNVAEWEKPTEEDFLFHKEIAGLLYCILCRTGGFSGASLKCEEHLGMTREKLAEELDSAIQKYYRKRTAE